MWPAALGPVTLCATVLVTAWLVSCRVVALASEVGEQGYRVVSLFVACWASACWYLLCGTVALFLDHGSLIGANKRGTYKMCSNPRNLRKHKGGEHTTDKEMKEAKEVAEAAPRCSA